MVTTSNGELKNLMDSHGLIDVGYSGPSFTRSNNRHGGALIRERLDRGIVNQE